MRVGTGTHLLIATRNAGKLRELEQLLAGLPFVLTNLADFPHIEQVKEIGKTFVENAVLKAAGYATQARTLTLADDSGLEIDALGGAPGVFSARYLGESASYAARINSLLGELITIDAARRNASFVSAIAIADTDGNVLDVSVGTCEGRIAFGARGSRGFGYDPIFVPDGYDLTFAELDTEVKNEISHRARALRGAREYLESLTSALHAD